METLKQEEKEEEYKNSNKSIHEEKNQSESENNSDEEDSGSDSDNFNESGGSGNENDSDNDNDNENESEGSGNESGGSGNEDEDEESEGKPYTTPPIKKKYNDTPILDRKVFPCSFWILKQLTEDDIPMLLEYTIETIEQLFDVQNIDIYIFQGNIENDRVRVICPDVFVNICDMKNIRSLLLLKYGYNNENSIIPINDLELVQEPSIWKSSLYDIGIHKTITQTFSCYNVDLMSNANIHDILIKCSQLYLERTAETEEYTRYHKTENVETECILEKKNSVNIEIQDSEISKDIKELLGGNIEKCKDYFLKSHPDSVLRQIKELDNNIFLLDFTKSKKKCKLCKIIHQSNRQYMTYSKKTEEAYYLCYDTNAYNKKIIISYKINKVSSIVDI